MKNTVCIVMLLSFLVHCSPSEKAESNAPLEDTVQSEPSPQSTAANPAQETSSDSLIAQQSIYEDTAKILLTGQFHEDEVWPEAAREEWYGLFNGSNGYYLAKSTLETRRVRDELLDMENEASGWLVTTENPDELLLFVSGLSFLEEKPLESIDSARRDIFPGDTLEFTYAGTDYAIFSLGIENPIVEERAYSPVSDYKLFMTADRNGKVMRQLLLEIENFDSEMIDILFAGDIDGDQVPDLIINTSRHYNVSSPTLYLSRPAKKGLLLKAMGAHRIVGC